MEELRQHAERLGTEVIYDHIEEVDLSRRPFTLKGGMDEYRTESLIIATGATARYLGLDSEQHYRGKACRRAPLATGFSSRAGRWRWSAAATRPLKKRSTCPISAQALPSCTGVTRCAQRR